MSDTNVVVLKGRLVRPAELKYTQSQRPYANFTLAVGEPVKKADGQWETRASYFDVTAWGNFAEATAKYLTKGREVLVSGRLRQDRWNDQTGAAHSRIVITADNFEILREPKGNTGTIPPIPAGNLPPPEPPAFSDPLPPIGEAGDKIPF